MADWKDFYEDNKETWGQYLDSLDAKKRPKELLKSPPSPRLEFCPLCHGAFLAEGLSEHIRSVHGPQHIYLRVNGQIIRDLGWAEHGISELRLIQLGFNDANVELISTGFKKKLSVTSNENLRRQLPSGFEGELTIRVTPNAAPVRQFIVYSRSLPEFGSISSARPRSSGELMLKSALASTSTRRGSSAATTSRTGARACSAARSSRASADCS